MDYPLASSKETYTTTLKIVFSKSEKRSEKIKDQLDACQEAFCCEPIDEVPRVWYNRARRNSQKIQKFNIKIE